MHPIKPKKIIAETASELSLPEEFLSQLVDFYYKDVARKLSNGEHFALSVPGLGTFSMKPRALERRIKKQQGLIDKLMESRSMQSFAIRMETQTELDAFRKLQKRMQDEQDRKEAIKLKRNYEKPDSNLEREG